MEREIGLYRSFEAMQLSSETNCLLAFIKSQWGYLSMWRCVGVRIRFERWEREGVEGNNVPKIALFLSNSGTNAIDLEAR